MRSGEDTEGKPDDGRQQQRDKSKLRGIRSAFQNQRADGAIVRGRETEIQTHNAQAILSQLHRKRPVQSETLSFDGNRPLVNSRVHIWSGFITGCQACQHERGDGDRQDKHECRRDPAQAVDRDLPHRREPETYNRSAFHSTSGTMTDGVAPPTR